jgi:hypothetical protein
MRIQFLQQQFDGCDLNDARVEVQDEFTIRCLLAHDFPAYRVENLSATADGPWHRVCPSRCRSAEQWPAGID